jgi:hypothetical protein
MAINIALTLASLFAAASGLFVVFTGSPVDAALVVFGASLAVMIATKLSAAG